MYLHMNPCPIKIQANENRTLHMLNKTIDDEPVCVCVYYTRIRILTAKDCLFLVATRECKTSYKNSRHTWNLATTHQSAAAHRLSNTEIWLWAMRLCATQIHTNRLTNKQLRFYKWCSAWTVWTSVVQISWKHCRNWGSFQEHHLEEFTERLKLTARAPTFWETLTSSGVVLQGYGVLDPHFSL
jgi:hypothetical protein